MHFHAPCTSRQELHRVGTGLWRFGRYRGDVQQGRDIGFHCHAPYTNSKQLHRVATVSRALSIALSNRFVAFGRYRRFRHHPFPTTHLPTLPSCASSYTRTPTPTPRLLHRNAYSNSFPDLLQSNLIPIPVRPVRVLLQ